MSVKLYLLQCIVLKKWDYAGNLAVAFIMGLVAGLMIAGWGAIR